MFTIRSVFCLAVLLAGFSVNAVAQVEPGVSYQPFSLGNVGVQDGQFVVEEIHYVNQPRTQTYSVKRPVTEQVEQTYTVEVPYTEQLPDKTTVQKTRTEQRTRIVNVTKYVEEQRTREYIVRVPERRLITVPDAAVSFSNLSGRRVADLESVRKFLQKGSQPAAIKSDTAPVNQFYHQTLNPKLIVVHLDRQKMVNLHFQRANEFGVRKQYDKVILEYRSAARLIPGNPDPWFSKAWVLATCQDKKVRDGKGAIQSAKRGLELVDKIPGADKSGIQLVVAAAYAAAGDFDTAVATLEAGIKSLGPGREETKGRFRSHLTFYKLKQALDGDIRVVLDSTGDEAFQAEFVKLEGDNVTLQKPDGAEVELPVSELSKRDQKWARESAEFARTGFPQYYFLMTTKQAEAQKQTLDSAPLTLRTQGQTAGTIWKATPAGDGYFYLSSAMSGRLNQVLESSDGDSAAVMDPKTGVTGTLWKTIPAGDGYFHLTSHYMEKAKKVLDGNVGEAKTDTEKRYNGAPYMTTNREPGTLWKFTPVQ